VQRVTKIGSGLLALLVVLLTTALCQQNWATALLAKQSPQVVYFADTRQPVVALTIDDGPDPATTPKILSLLKQHNARATFFLIANHIPGNEAVVWRMVQEQHEIANHLTVDEPSIDLSPSEFEQKLVSAHRVLSKFSTPRWFRPGSGWYNNKILTIASKYNYQTALGSIYPFDPQIPWPWFATQQILWHVQPGSIIILHDNGARGQRTLATLAAILPELENRGYRVVTLSELLNAQIQTAQRKERTGHGLQ